MEFNSEDEMDDSDMIYSDDQSSSSSYISEEDSQMYSSSEEDSNFGFTSDDSEEYDYMGGSRDVDHHMRRHYTPAMPEERYEPVQQKKSRKGRKADA